MNEQARQPWAPRLWASVVSGAQPKQRCVLQQSEQSWRGWKANYFVGWMRMTSAWRRKRPFHRQRLFQRLNSNVISVLTKLFARYMLYYSVPLFELYYIKCIKLFSSLSALFAQLWWLSPFHLKCNGMHLFWIYIILLLHSVTTQLDGQTDTEQKLLQTKLDLLYSHDLS